MGRASLFATAAKPQAICKDSLLQHAGEGVGSGVLGEMAARGQQSALLCFVLIKTSGAGRCGAIYFGCGGWMVCK